VKNSSKTAFKFPVISQTPRLKLATKSSKKLAKYNSKQAIRDLWGK